MHAVRHPAVAGSFYPADPATLRRQIDGFLDEARTSVEADLPEFERKTLSAELGENLGDLLEKRDVEAQKLAATWAGSTDPPLVKEPSVQLMLAPDGEILAKGPNVFSGYHDDPAATREAFTEDGWFKTGDIGRMTDPFTRGDPSRNTATGGAGLGLALARAIAEQHGGSLVLANRPEGGLRAEIVLPH